MGQMSSCCKVNNPDTYIQRIWKNMKICEFDIHTFETKSLAIIMETNVLSDEENRKEFEGRNPHKKVSNKTESTVAEGNIKFLRRGNRRSSTQKSSQVSFVRGPLPKDSGTTLGGLFKVNTNTEEQETEINNLKKSSTLDTKNLQAQAHPNSSSVNFNDFAQIAYKLIYDSDEKTNIFFKYHNIFISKIAQPFDTNNENILWDLIKLNFVGLLKKDINKPTEFFKLVCNIEKSNSVKWGLFQSRLRDFFHTNLVLLTEIVRDNFDKKEAKETELTIDDFNMLIEDKFNKENIESVIELIETNLRKHLNVGKIDKSHQLSQQDVVVLFKGYEYLFEFCEMRNYFVITY